MGPVFSDLLKEVARGRKGARDLTHSEALAAARLIVDQNASLAQIGAFLASERIKTESAPELLAFIEVLRSRLSVPPPWRHDGGLDTAGPFDGRQHTFYATIPAAFIVGSQGQPVLLHGVRSPLPPKRGIGLAEVLIELHLPLPATARQTQKAYEELGITFLDGELLCPPLYALRPLREELGFRTLFNTVEKMLNPADNSHLLMGIFHRTQRAVLTDLVSSLNYRNVLIVQGAEGSEDIVAHRPSVVWHIAGRNIEELTVTPSEAGLTALPDRITLSAHDQAQAILHILSGAPHPFRDVVVLNAGLRLWFTGYARTWQEGTEIAGQALDRGKAAAVYERWRAWGHPDDTIA